MARIRTIKPEFFRHEELYEAEVSSGLPLRVAFAGMFTVADREGRFKWHPRVLKLDVMPFDDVDFADVLEALATHGFLVKYQVGKDIYGHIPNFLKHQHVNQRELDSAIPAPDSADACTCENIPAHGEGERELEREGKGKLSLRSSDARARKAELELEFSETFYPAYPHKVQRAAALKAWPRARDKASLEQIMTGLEQYIRDKPPDRHWQNPATFLNGESWNDQPASPPVPATRDKPHDTIFRALAAVAGEGLGRSEREPDADAGRDGFEPPAGRDPDSPDPLEIPAILRRTEPIRSSH